MSAPDRPSVTILTSGIGLGVYIPALLIERQLTRGGVAAEVEVIEAYYTEDGLRRHVAHREACRSNFALAQMAHRMTRGVDGLLDRQRIDALLDSWSAQERVDFIIWSGFWLPILEHYRSRVPHLRLHRDVCRIDAEMSASFKIHRELESGAAEIWLWKGATKEIVHQIPVTTGPPPSFAEREHRLVAHGGGWGLGTYGDVLPALEDAGYALDVVVHSPDERERLGPPHRCYMIDPAWEAWHRGPSGRHGFPPMGVVCEGGAVAYDRSDDCHEFHRVIRQAKAIVSKPGGGTLIDSLAAATPVVLLEAYGYAEQANALVWSHLGFGIPEAAWQADGYAAEPLERAHAALMAHGRAATGYPGAYARRRQERLQL